MVFMNLLGNGYLHVGQAMENAVPQRLSLYQPEF